MSLTNSFETDLLELIFDNTTLANIGDVTGLAGSTADGDLFIALTTTTPTDSSAGTECTYGAYARQAVSRTDGFTVSGNNASNAAAVTFPEATSGSETATYFEIYTAVTSGDRLAYGEITTPSGGLAISTGITPEFAIGALDINID